MASSPNFGGHRVDLSIDSFQELRKRATVRAAEEDIGQLVSPVQADGNRLLEELRIHQIELEMQNDELRRVRAELETSRAFFFDLYEQAPEGYITVDKAGAILQANLRAADLFAVNRSALVGQNFSRSIAPEGQDQYYLTRKLLFQKSEPQVCEVKMMRPENPPFWARLKMSCALENGGQVCRIMIVDITEHRLLEDALHAANLQLLQEKKAAEDASNANHAKSQFLSTMTHEIRTPLSGLIGMAGLLLQTELNSEQLSYARIVADSGEVLLGLVNNILDFSKIEAGGLELDETAFDLESLIEDVLDLMSFKVREKSLELACWYAPDVPRRFVGDAGRLRQVLMNLLSNAVKFTDSGYVLIEVEAVEIVADRCFVEISIHDTGIGISKQNLSRLFTRFRQADPTISRRFGGTGLGLSIAKQIVDRMGGELSVTSMDGKGSTFSCKIPLKRDYAEGREALDSAPLAGLSVLVSGGKIARFVVSEWCRRWGMNVQSCDLAHLPNHLEDSAKDARDFQMVIMDGSASALVKAIPLFRAHTGASSPKLVLLSVDSLEQTKYLQADAVLSTPVRAKKLCEKLCELVPNARVQPSSAERISEAVPIQLCALNVLKVLVIDDSLVNQKLACALLAKLGCQVDTADGGEEAVEKVSRNEYSLVFMDCVMPGMDGFQATTAIRNLASQCSNVPIVALTASATAEDRDHCFAVGMNDFLTKPIRTEQLASCLTKWRKS